MQTGTMPELLEGEVGQGQKGVQQVGEVAELLRLGAAVAVEGAPHP